MALIGSMIRKRKLDELISAWVEFRDMVTRHTGKGTATPEQETQFLSLKARISSRMPLLMEIVGQVGVHPEVQTHVRAMTDLMNGQLSLSRNGDFSDAEKEDFLSRWHTQFLYMNQVKGISAESRPSRPMAAPPSMASLRGSAAGRFLHGLFDNWLTRFVVRLAVLTAFIIIGARVLHIDLRQAPEWGQKIYHEWWGGGTAGEQASTPGGPTSLVPGGKHAVAGGAASARAATGKIDQAVRNVQGGQNNVSTDRTIHLGGDPRKRPTYSVDGSGAYNPPQGPGPVRWFVDKLRPLVPRPMRDFFHPVVQAWGAEATVALVGIGLLLIAYMIFGRAR